MYTKIEPQQGTEINSYLYETIFRLRAWHGARALKCMLFTHANYQEIGDKFVFGASTGFEKVNTACTVKTCSDQ